MPGESKTWARLLGRLRELARRHWQRALILRERLFLNEETLHLLMAGIIGLIGAFTRRIYGLANELLQWSFLGGMGELVDLAESMAPWQRLLVPCLGGLGAGLVLYYGLRLLGNPGLSNLLEVVVAGDGRLSLRTAIVNAVSSLLSLSTGASIGREGLIIQVSATLSSKLGQLPKWPPYRLRLMVACGAASAMAASYNTPIAGALFAAQIVLGNFSMKLFAPLVFSSVVAAVLSRSFFGISQWYTVPTFDFTRLTELPWFILLGVVCGAVGAGFLKMLRQAENLFGRLPVPLYLRMALAGFMVGFIGLKYPEVWGNGYQATDQLLHQRNPILLAVVGLFVAKLLATTVSVGSGAVGGVFTPTLFLGAALGSAFGISLHAGGFAPNLQTGVFALVGMAALLAATTHSPLLAILMIFELSLNYSLMPAFMLACVVSTLVARSLHPESIYTEPLRRKGFQLQRESTRIGAATEATVADLMRQPVPPLRETTTFQEIADRFLTSSNNFLPVVDEQSKLLGVVALQDLKEYLHAGQELSSVIAFDVMRPPPNCVTPTQTLPDALPVLLTSELQTIPVVSPENKLVGGLARNEALGVLGEAISARRS